ncbi:hypothetical protein BKA70DRAFT_1266400 [Coprinopsis sp. MPI-PUGE-AT-0042]|nr:hypothetical protein BKA70DRAFT_1266400 [Coprinopsis sp. MPI-PUGE-AT-0042]
MNSALGFPPEIWVQIFRMATTDITSSLEHFHLGPHRLAEIWHESKGYLDSLATKLALVKTCREWNAMVTPLLYEHVAISSIAQYERLIQTLGENTGIPEELGEEVVDRKRNHLVSRLDIFLPKVATASAIAVELFGLFPQLQTAVASLGWTQEDNTMAPLLFQTLPSCLHHFLWTINWLAGYNPPSVPLSSMGDFSTGHPRLETLSHPCMIDFTVQGVLSNHQWPSLRALVFQEKTQAVALSLFPESLPRIRSLICAIPLVWLYQILSAQTKNLTAIYFPLEEHLISQLNAGQFPPEVEEIYFPASSLFWANRASVLEERAVTVDTVNTLGLSIGDTFDEGPQTSKEIEVMHTIVSGPWMDIFPSLKTIRIMDHVDPKPYRLHANSGRLPSSSPCGSAEHTIRVEDISGRFLAELSVGPGS